MRLLVLGIGDCGCRIAGEFSDLNRKAKAEQRVQIVTNAYAINNNQDYLAKLKTTHKDLVTIFTNRSIAGDARSAKAGADIMREEGSRILTSVNPSDFYNTDAILLVAGSAGYFGSGGLPVMAQQLKDRHTGKPVYGLLVLPSEVEATESSGIVNTAVCLKSTLQTTEAVFLVDNIKFKHADKQANEDLSAINKDIVAPYYDLLCASEPIDPKYTGARTLGIGDMLQTLKGWTAIGIGSTEFQVAVKSFWKTIPSFREKGEETQKALEAMGQALGNLSIDFNLPDAHKAMYLLSVPAEGANVNMVKVVSNRLLDLTNHAEIRGGDFYGVRNCAQVTLIMSDIAYIETVKNYYDQAISLTKPAVTARPIEKIKLDDESPTPARATASKTAKPSSKTGTSEVASNPKRQKKKKT